MTRVAILIPSFGQRELANLARDAIAAFTQDVAHDVYLLDHGGGQWKEQGSEANMMALAYLRSVAGDLGVPVGHDSYTHIFIMHDDALPLRAGWLSFLLNKPLPATAMVSARSGRGHSAGTLFDSDDFEGLDLEPNLPEYDVAENVPLGWGARRMAWRGEGSCGGWTPPKWMRPFECDIALDDEGEPFYLHLGGGTIGAGATHPQSQEHYVRVQTWINSARWALNL